MLEMTLQTEFLPGTNLKGKVAGGNWVFVLPSLEMGRVVSLGVPSRSTLATLSRHAASVQILCGSRRQVQEMSEIVRLRGYPNVTVQHAPDMASADILMGSTDLLLIANRKEVFRWAWSGANRQRMREWLQPQGMIYFETSGVDRGFLAASLCRSRKLEVSREWWTTPIWGEAHTFVETGDAVATQFFLEKNLGSVSLRADTLKLIQNQLNQFRPGLEAPKRRTRDPRSSPPADRRTKLRFSTRLKAIARAAIQKGVRASGVWERFLSNPKHVGRWLGRRGLLLGRAGSPKEHGPPKYLRDMAWNAGLRLDSFRWGLSASGDYDSRKVVFFLFPPQHESPSYVVKMTRSERFNRRLDQERRALQLLERKGVGDRETLPRVVFDGIHGGLAMVGETAIDGVPFDRRTTATVDCPYARGAISWLTQLAGKTVASLGASSGEVAAGMSQLLNRFAALYQPSEDEYAFLRAQIALLEFNPVPLVFQHGDPGRWNVLVTRTGRVSFLDWEAAEPNGLPLWDLLYFLRSYCMCVAQSGKNSCRLASFERLFLSDSPFATLAAEAISNYCSETGMGSRLIEPLFYTCWMHRALKEATRLPVHQLHQGHYVNLLRLCIAKHDTAQLQRYFHLTH